MHVCFFQVLLATTQVQNHKTIERKQIKSSSTNWTRFMSQSADTFPPLGVIYDLSIAALRSAWRSQIFRKRGQVCKAPPGLDCQSPYCMHANKRPRQAPAFRLPNPVTRMLCTDQIAKNPRP